MTPEEESEVAFAARVMAVAAAVAVLAIGAAVGFALGPALGLACVGAFSASVAAAAGLWALRRLKGGGE